MSVLDPASAVAAGLCLTARRIANGRTARHPRPCGWCTYELADLQTMILGFEVWADRDLRTGAYRQFDANVFQSLTAREQAELVLAAQAFEPEPESVPAPALPADEPDEPTEAKEGPAWLY